MAREIEHVAYFKIETRGAAAKLRELIRLGGDAIEGPWDGEEAITLLADLDAGATGAMTGGGYPGRHPADRRRTTSPGGATRPCAAYERWLPLINYENRQCGLLAAKALMKEGGVIGCEAPRHPIAPLHPATRAGLMETAGGWTRWCCAGGDLTSGVRKCNQLDRSVQVDERVSGCGPTPTGQRRGRYRSIGKTSS